MAVPLRVVTVHRPHPLQQGSLRQAPPTTSLKGLAVGPDQLAHLGRSGTLYIALPHEFSMNIPALACQKTPYAQTPRRTQAIVIVAVAEKARVLRSRNHGLTLLSVRTVAFLTTGNDRWPPAE